MYRLVADYFSIAFAVTTTLTMVFLFLRGRPGLEHTLKLICCLGGAISVALDVTYVNHALDTISGINNISWLLISVVKTIALYSFGLLIYALVRKEPTKKLFTLVTLVALVSYIVLWPLTVTSGEIFLVNVDLPVTYPELRSILSIIFTLSHSSLVFLAH